MYVIPIGKIGGLDALRQLRALTIGKVRGLDALGQLRTLAIGKIRGLDALGQLRTLAIGKIGSLDALGQLRTLAIGKIRGLDALRQLRALTIGNVRGLDALRQLRALTIGKIGSLDALRQLRALTIGKVRGLDALGQLRTLAIGKIRGLDALGQLRTLAVHLHIAFVAAKRILSGHLAVFKDGLPCRLLRRTRVLTKAVCAEGAALTVLFLEGIGRPVPRSCLLLVLLGKQASHRAVRDSVLRGIGGDGKACGYRNAESEDDGFFEMDNLFHDASPSCCFAVSFLWGVFPSPFVLRYMIRRPCEKKWGGNKKNWRVPKFAEGDALFRRA